MRRQFGGTYRHAVLVATATLGTTLAPWGLAFIQSYAVDKKLKPADWRLSRLDIGIGSMLTGIIGVFVVAWAGSIVVYRYKGLDKLDVPSG